MSSEQDEAILNAIFNPLFLNEEGFFEDESNLVDNDEDFGEDVKALERKAVSIAEEGNIDDAIQLFTQIIEQCPLRAATYNNRAQAYRIKENMQEAFLDLNTAIKLSNGLGRTACRAFCQRGIMHFQNGHTDSARNDFEEAGKLGSSFAKEQLVKLNPYAALCNQMLQDVFQKLRGMEKNN